MGTIYSVLSAVIFGFTPLIAKSIYSFGFSYYGVAFGRFLIGSLYLFIVVKIQHKHKILLPQKQLLHIFIISVFYALMITFLYSSYEYIDSGAATTLHFSYPVLVIIIAALFYKRKLNKAQILCTVLAMLGIFFLNNSTSSVNYLGVIFALLSGFSYALYIVLSEKMRVDEIPIFVLSFWISVFSIFVVAVLLVFTPHSKVQINAKAIALFALLALIVNVFAIVLFQKGLGLCGGVKASLLSTFEPLTSVIVGVIVYKEQMTFRTIFGIALILSATVVLIVKNDNVTAS